MFLDCKRAGIKRKSENSDGRNHSSPGTPKRKHYEEGDELCIKCK